MHVLLVNHSPIPVFADAGKKRVIWDLGPALVQMGHRVSYLVPEGSHCDFAQVLPIRPGLSWAEQVPADVDVVHFQFNPKEDIGRPFLVTEHGNGRDPDPLALNTVFVSRNHAERHGSQRFVHNGLDWQAYGPVDFGRARGHHHFLGKAAWRVKNVKGAIRVAAWPGWSWTCWAARGSTCAAVFASPGRRACISSAWWAGSRSSTCSTPRAA